MNIATFTAADGLARCFWCSATPEYIDYHDREWGFPVTDDVRLFEKLSLEAFQSGLSWRTILTKRPHFRSAFCGFDFHRVARFTEDDVQRLLADSGIVRHRGKIEATIHNAQRALALTEEAGSLTAFVWRYATEPTEGPVPVRAQSPESVALSKALKQRGWKFVGPTTVYAFMQAAGLVNDHAEGCAVRAQAKVARSTCGQPSSNRTS